MSSILQRLAYCAQLTLAHHGECSLLGVAPGPVFFVEEFYGDDDGWLAQRALRLDGAVIAQMDEAWGTRAGAPPLELPDNIVRPASVSQRHPLTSAARAGAAHALRNGLTTWSSRCLQQ